MAFRWSTKKEVFDKLAAAYTEDALHPDEAPLENRIPVPDSFPRLTGRSKLQDGAVAGAFHFIRRLAPKRPRVVGVLEPFSADPSKYQEGPHRKYAAADLPDDAIFGNDTSEKIAGLSSGVCKAAGLSSGVCKAAGLSKDQFVSTETQSPDVAASDTVPPNTPPNIPESTATPSSNRYEDYTDYYNYQEWVNTEGHPDRENHPVFDNPPATSYSPEKIAAALGLDQETKNAIRREQADQAIGRQAKEAIGRQAKEDIGRQAKEDIGRQVREDDPGNTEGPAQGEGTPEEFPIQEEVSQRKRKRVPFSQALATAIAAGTATYALSRQPAGDRDIRPMYMR